MQDVDEQILGPSVYDDILFAPLNYGMKKAKAEQLARDVIEKLGIESIQGKMVHYLSRGEKKRVALAGALVLEPALLILDEPFTGVDPLSRRDIVDILNRLNKEKGITFIMTLHEVDLASVISDVLYLMHGHGDLSERGRPDEIFGKFKDLGQFNLEEPTLMKLFKGLKKEGLDFGEPFRLDEAITFDRLFPLFFSPGQPPMMNGTGGMSADGQQMLEDALRQLLRELRAELMRRLAEGRPLTPEELQQLGQQAGLQNAGQMYQRQWITRRMLQQLGMQDLQEGVAELMELLAALGMGDEARQQLREAMQGNAEALEEQVDDYVGQQIAENMAQEYEKRPPLDDLMNRPFETLTERFRAFASSGAT